MTESTKRWRELPPWGVAAGVVLLALLVRVVIIGMYNELHPNDASWLGGDEPDYNNTALELLGGLGYTYPGRVPGYPVWLAALHWITDNSYHAIRYYQGLLATGTVLLTWLVGRRIFDDKVALLAAFAAAFSYVLVHQALHLLSEVLFTPLVLVITLVLWRAWQEPTRARFLWVGFWIGVSALVRPTLLFFPVFLVLPLWIAHGRSRALRYGALIATATLVTVAPWLVRNRIKHDAWFPLATSQAFLWLGSPEYYHLLRDEGYTYMRVWTDVIFGPEGSQHSPGTIEGDRWWTARALRSIRAEPLTYARFSAEKMVTFWVGDPHADWNNERVFSYGALRRAGYRPLAAVQVMLARLLPLVALAAVVVLWRERRRLLPVYSILVFVTLLHALGAAVVRLSEPFQPLQLVLVAGAVVRLYQRWQERRAAVPATAVAR